MSRARGEELGGEVPCSSMFKCEGRNNLEGTE